VRWSRNLFLLSARGHEAIMTVHKEAKETKAFIVGDYRGEYWR
jgi:hypothetical protein